MTLGRNAVSFLIATAFIMAIQGCSNTWLVFGSNEGFCDDCGYENKGVCSNPADVYNNRELIENKPASCGKDDKWRRDGKNRPEIVINEEEKYDD